MANLTAAPGLTAVPQIETTTLLLGGPGGPLNQQAQALLNQAAYGRQSANISYTAPGSDGIALQAALRAELVNVNLYAVAGETDHTAMFNRATAAARKVYVPAGTYYLDSANWPSNTEIYGDGHTSILHVRAAGRCAFLVNSPSANVLDNVQNLYMHDLQLRGEVDVPGVGFAEHNHLLNLNGVTNVTIERCLFKGFRGDGLYFGSHSDGGLERHNEKCKVINCIFDGINRDNRNGITFIDVDGALVEDCHFTNCSRSNMPGAIDFEPDVFSFHVIRNVTIKNNMFTGNGGNVAEIAFYVPPAVTFEPRNILIEGNTSLNYLGSGHMFYFSMNRASSNTSPCTDIRLLNNHAVGGFRPFQIANGRRIVLRGNTFTDMAESALLGWEGVNARVIDCVIEQSRFERCGSTGGNGLTVGNADFLSFLDTKFIDCGTGVPGAANAIDFSNGTSSVVTFSNVEFIAPTGKTLVAIQKEVAHTFAPSGNRFTNNRLSGMTSAFVADKSDVLDVVETAWTPVASGATGAGSGTYANQMGIYRVVMGRVTGTVNIAWSAHTGTGQLLVSLPVSPNTLEPGFIPINVIGAVTVAAGAQVVGMINKGATRIQLYTLNAGVLAALPVPASGELYISFSYAG